MDPEGETAVLRHADAGVPMEEDRGVEIRLEAQRRASGMHHARLDRRMAGPAPVDEAVAEVVVIDHVRRRHHELDVVDHHGRLVGVDVALNPETVEGARQHTHLRERHLDVDPLIGGNSPWDHGLDRRAGPDAVAAVYAPDPDLLAARGAAMDPEFDPGKLRGVDPRVAVEEKRPPEVRLQGDGAAAVLDRGRVMKVVDEVRPAPEAETVLELVVIDHERLGLYGPGPEGQESKQQCISDKLEG